MPHFLCKSKPRWLWYLEHLVYHSLCTNQNKFCCFQGWVECVGCADRSAFDLNQHTKATGVRLAAEKKLPEPRTIDIIGMCSPFSDS